MNKSQYRRYLASREWALLKIAVSKRSGGKCERCMVAKYEATHHLTYERIGHEELADLLAVCERCHEFLSGKSDCDPSKATAELANSILSETTKESPNLHKIYTCLHELGEEELCNTVVGFCTDLQTSVEERYMPALCEHFEEWRDADRAWKELQNRPDGKIVFK